MFRSTTNSVGSSLNSSSIETTYSLGSTNSQTFLSLDIDDFCQSYSKLKLLEKDPAQDVTSPISSSQLLITNSPSQPELFETNQQQAFIDNELSNNQQVSNESFSRFLAYLTKQDEEQNSILVTGQSDSNNASSQVNRIYNPSPRTSSLNQQFSLSNNFTTNNSLNNSLSNEFIPDANNNNPSNFSSPSTPTIITSSINPILHIVTSPSNSIDPKDSKTKLASPKRKGSVASNNTSNTSTSSSSSCIPPQLNTKLTKQSKTTRKRKNSSTSPSQLSMQFNFPMWTFHFSKGQSNRQ